MSIVNEPEDILGMALSNLLTPILSNAIILNKIKNWNRTIILEVIGLYPITLTFNNSEITIVYGEKPKYHIKISITLEALLNIAEGKLGLISAFLRRKVKVKKIFRILTILKFRRVLFSALKLTQKPLV